MDGHLYESTGLNGRSSLRMDDLATGRVLQSAPVPQQYFAEGLAAWGSTLVQLTWQSHVAFVYDRFSFRLLRTLALRLRRLGAHRRRQKPDPQRRHRGDSLLRPRHIPRGAAHLRRAITASRSTNSTSSNTFTARSTPTCGTPTALCASRPRRAACWAGSISPACFSPAKSPIRKPCSTASPTTPCTTASSSPASCGPNFLRSRWFQRKPKPFPSITPVACSKSSTPVGAPSKPAWVGRHDPQLAGSTD